MPTTFSIAILNLMPTKEATARQLSQLLNQQNQVKITLLYPESHYLDKPLPTNLAKDYLSFEEAKKQNYDGFIVTGAPVEQLAYEDVDYWQELTDIFSYLKTSAIPSLFICWGAQAAMYYYYQIPKKQLNQKLIGIFQHQLNIAKHPLLAQSKSTFLAPHSRYTAVDEALVRQQPELITLASSKEAGLYLVANQTGTETYMFGHAEYDCLTLANEYFRDSQRYTKVPFPVNYFPENNPQQRPLYTWQAHGEALFQNWLNQIKSFKQTTSTNF